MDPWVEIERERERDRERERKREEERERERERERGREREREKERGREWCSAVPAAASDSQSAPLFRSVAEGQGRRYLGRPPPAAGSS